MLAAGTQLGPYRILAALGAGGMGEVYRARDTRLARDVAVKVLPPQFSADAERLRRFEQEARAAGALSHPNVCTLYDIGSHEGAPYVVMELLEGQSLRERLRDGALPWRKAADYAAQATTGLAAAHGKGIVHRDLKPENLFVTKDGRVKVLDFGLAKLTRPEAAGETAPTISVGPTETGGILGTVGYMSPEQVRGQAVDARSDLFALGTILHEMVTGERTFRGASPVETLNAILTAEPAALAAAGREVPPALELIVRRCLEKSAEERFQSARDLAFDLRTLSGAGGSGAISGVPVATPATRRRRAALLALSLVAAAAAVAGSYVVGQRIARPAVPSYQRVTFRRGGMITSSRFTPDGQSVVYSTRYPGERPNLYMRRLSLTDARSLDLPGAQVVGMSGGEMAILHGAGILARMPIEGGTPRDIAEGIWFADWSADGSKFAVVRPAEKGYRLECPIGKVLLETTNYELPAAPRISPKGDRVAYMLKVNANAFAGQIEVVDLAGRRQVLSKELADFDSPIWSRDGREVWFTATRKGGTLALYAVTLAGRERLVLRAPGGLLLRDIAPDGRALMLAHQQRLETRGMMAGDSVERDLSWLDGTLNAMLTPDGQQMLFNEWGEGGGEWLSVYMRRNDKQAPVRLGDGALIGMSRDGKWALVQAGPPWQSEARMLPTGAGEAYTIPRGPLAEMQAGALSPDGKRVLVGGAEEKGKPLKWYVKELPDGPLRPIGPPHGLVSDVRGNGGVTPDGLWYPGRPPGERAPHVLYPVDGGPPRPIPWLQVDDEPFQWSDDSRYLYVCTPFFRMPIVVTRIDMRTGERRPWLRLLPPDRVGVEGSGVYISTLTPDGRYYAYNYQRHLTDLYVVSGLR